MKQNQTFEAKLRNAQDRPQKIDKRENARETNRRIKNDPRGEKDTKKWHGGRETTRPREEKPTQKKTVTNRNEKRAR